MDEAEIDEVNVQVAVRCRPMSGKEIAEGSHVIAEFPGDNQIHLIGQKKEKHQYAFDHIFPMDSAQLSVFNALGIPLLDKAFEGYNSTIFAYGQTGSGKTHTMMSHRAAPDDRGLIPRISEGLYGRIASLMQEHETRRFLVCCSFLEIYNEIIFDLLVPRAKQAKGGLEVREQKGIGVYVKDLTEMVVESADKLSQLIESGFEHRTTAATKMNEGSSRSHCIFIIKLHQKDTSDESKNTFSKLNLVDLAGSERAKATEAEGDRLKEGANINKSLSALGNVINALSSVASGNKKVFVPYRNSKLTRVLQESLGGNSLCTMVAAISPSSTNLEETLSTLNYAKRAKTIKVSATKNDEASQVKKLEEEVEALRRKLAMQAESSAGGMNAKEKHEIEAKYESQISELQSFMKQSWEEKQKLSEQHEEQQRKVQEEAKRAAEKLMSERKKRIDMLERNGDLQLSLQALQATGGKLAQGWPDNVAEALKVEQQLRAQLRAVKLFRDSSATDFAMCIGCKVSDVVAIITLLNQVQSKLGSMASELKTFGGLEAQFDKQMSSISPQVGVALREAQKMAEDSGGSSDEAQHAQEIVDLVRIVQKQLSQHHAKVKAFVQAERGSLRFGEELKWLLQCLNEDGASPSNTRTQLKNALRAEVDGTGAASDAGTVSEELYRDIGLSTFELGDERLTASSNADGAHCARLKQTLLYGGWTPVQDRAEEFLEIDLGEESRILGVSLQGRLPCTPEWTQTRDLLQLVLKNVTDVPTTEKVYKRPPVRLIHDVGVALGAGDWSIPPELQNYGDLSREQKVTFFEALIQHTNAAWKAAQDAGLPALQLTAQDILSGKNCDESNRLMQLLSYLKLRADMNTGGLTDAAPQWTTQWKLSYCRGGSVWKWYGSPDGGDPAAAKLLDGNSDYHSVKFLRLPEPLLASKLRIHPVQWYQHASLRCEIHVAAVAGSLDAAAGAASASGTSLEDSVTLTTNSIAEVKRGIEERKMARQAEEEEKQAQVSALKDKAEQERDLLDQRLNDALARVKELTEKNDQNEQRAGNAETELLKMQVERDRLEAQVEQLGEQLTIATEQKEATSAEVATLREEHVQLQTSVDEFTQQLEVMTEERDLARQKEEELFEQLEMKDEDLMDTNNGYVYLTQRLQDKEDEMEALQDDMGQLKDANDKFHQRNQELFDEAFELRKECQSLKVRFADRERDLKATEERYLKLLKDNMSANVGHSTGVSNASTQPSEANRVGYEDDFE